MSRFWNHYAQANDDVRNKLIDEAWFERQTGATPFQDDVAMMQSRAQEEPEPPPDPEHEQVYGRDPEQTETADLYGQDISAPEGEAASDRAFYGYDALDAPEHDEPDIEPER